LAVSMPFDLLKEMSRGRLADQRRVRVSTGVSV
jgi:hypothetical protein